MSIKRTYSTKAKTKGSTTKVIASTGNPDRYADIVVWDKNADLENYKNNPVVQFGHNYDIPPIGKTVDLQINPRNGDLIAEIRWDDSPDNPLAQTVKRQFEQGYMSAVSVGFQPGESTPRNRLPKDHPAYGEKGALMTSPKLLEISAVPVPANAEALALRGISGVVAKHILKVEETEDSFVVHYAKPEMAEAEEEDEMPDDEMPEDEEQAFGDDEDEEDGFGDEEDDDKEHEPGHDDEEDEEEDGYGHDDDEEDAFGDDEEDEEDEEKAYRLRRQIREVMLDLLHSDPVVRSMTRSSSKPQKRSKRDPLAELLGIDN
tara:strand:+ start:72 stop:1022 length:951 start_codon:yes stop_codon:yes gene_type:complete